MIDLLIVSRVRMVRESIAAGLGRDDAFRVVGSMDPEGEVADALDALRPDVGLVDASEACGLACLTENVRRAGNVRWIAMGFAPEQRTILACAAAGVDGFLPFDTPLDGLGPALSAAYRGEIRCPTTAAVLIRAASRHPTLAVVGRPDGPATDAEALLTARELEVVDLIERGLSNKEIAVELGLGVSTVKHHVHSILHKLQVRRRAQVALRRRA